MALSHLALDTERYEIYLDNKIVEDKLKDSDESSASCFETIFNSSLDLSPLLYLKSTSAELALNQFSVDDLPLTTSKKEEVKLKITLPNDLAHCNQSFNIEKLEISNGTIYKIPFGDFTTSENAALINLLNKKLNITLIVLKVALAFIFDTDIFKDGIELKTTEISGSDARLIGRYLDCILFSRHIVHRYISRILEDGDESLDGLVKFSNNSVMAAAEEKQIIAKSMIFRSVDERVGVARGKTMDLKIFPGDNLKSAYSKQGGTKLRIETEIADLFSDITMVERTNPNDPSSPLKDKSRDDLIRYRNSNKKLAIQAMYFKTLVSFLQQNDHHKVSAIFNNRIMAFELVAGSRLKVILNPSLFLPPDGTSIALHFPEQLSYVLGCNDKTTLEIGPFSNQSNENPIPQEGQPKLTNHITVSGQSPHSSMRPMPRILYVCSDIVSSVGRNLWLRDTPYENCNIIYTHVLDDTNLTTQFLCKNTDTLTFHRISSLNSLWNSFSLYILDQNFRKVIFPLRSYTKIGLIIKPTNHGD